MGVQDTSGWPTPACWGESSQRQEIPPLSHDLHRKRECREGILVHSEPATHASPQNAIQLTWLPMSSGSLEEVMIQSVPLPPDQVTTQRGDIWILGNYRLMCGDSSSPRDLDTLLNGAIIQLVNTDPPYNVKVEPRFNIAIAAGLSSFGSASAVAAADAKGMHHQGFDLARDKSKATKTTRK